MARNGSGVYSLPAGSTIANGETSDQTDLNTPLSDLEADANAARPIVAGGTGATSASGARTNLGLGDFSDAQNNLGLGTAATKNTGTGSGEVPVLDGDGLLDRALLPGAGVADKAADYTAVSDDAGTLLKFTGAHTLTLPSASTLPDGWSVIVVADGGDVTIASDSFINGSSGDYTVSQGLFVYIFNRGFSYDVLGVSELTPTQAEDDTDTTFGLVSGERLAEAVAANARGEISSATASNDATVEFTLPSGYSSFQVVFEGVIPATDGSLLLSRLSSDGGSTFRSGASDYGWSVRAFKTTAGSNATDNDDHIQIAGISGIPIGSDTGEGGVSGGLDVIGNANSGVRTALVLHATYFNNGNGISGSLGQGVARSATTDDAIQFYMDSGNIESGVFRLYGKA